MTGVVPYPDILRSTIDYYFGWGGSEHSLDNLDGKRMLQKEINFKLLAQFIPSGSQLFGDPLIKAVNPVTGVYTNETNKQLNTVYDINSQYKVADFQDNQDKQITVQTKASIFKPIAFDFILFREVGVVEKKFVIDQEARRNYHENNHALKLMTPQEKEKMLTQTTFGQTNNQITSVMGLMRKQLQKMRQF